MRLWLIMSARGIFSRG